MEGKTIRLRASCNSCNESKVRCSQHKPTCSRCERHGTECVYGLSRRSHKDAPSISTPPSQRARRHSPASSNSERPRTAEPKDRLLDFSNILTASSSSLPDSLSTAATEFLTPGTEYANHYVMGALDFCGNNNGDAFAVTNMEAFWSRQMSTAGLVTAPPTPQCGECSCHAGVRELLLSMRWGGNDQRLSVDVQLAKLKRCIVSSETSMGCTHGRDDAEPIHIMTVATLIGYVVDHFEALASEFPLRGLPVAAASESLTGEDADGPGTSGSAMVTTDATIPMRVLLEPRLSWGVLELEDDDEMDLRQRLYLLSFRKLERLLSQLTLYLRNLRDVQAGLPDPSRHMAFVMACDYTRLWLEKKAEDVKRLFMASIRDERLDPQLSRHL